MNMFVELYDFISPAFLRRTDQNLVVHNYIQCDDQGLHNFIQACNITPDLCTCKMDLLKFRIMLNYEKLICLEA